jgi:hypothetical protein
MKRFERLTPALAMALALCACTAGQTTAPPIHSVNPGDPNYGKLQFAVGTANIALNGGPPTIGLNVVSTLRQPNGFTAFGADQPTITGPFTFPIPAVPAVGGALPDPYNTIFTGFPSASPNGPSLPETLAAAPAITNTPQSIHVGTPFCDAIGAVPPGFTSCPSGFTPDTSTFGQSGGAFAMGLAPYNASAAAGTAYSYVPYAQPLYDSANPHPRWLPWGGPPAFDPDNNGTGTRDGLIPAGVDTFGLPFFLGVAEGITVFQGVTPGSGTYTLTVVIPYLSPSGTPQSVTKVASATLNTATVLPAVTAPLVTPDGGGGATIAPVVLAGGVTEAYIQIVDYGPGGGPNASPSNTPNCQGAKGTQFAPVYYTIHVTSSGPVPPLTNNHGPNVGTGLTVTPSPTICTAAQNQAAVGVNAGDNIVVQMIGFDYPIYQAALSLTQPGTPQTPPITGGSGQADITVSVQQEEDAPGYGQTPLSARRASMARSLFTARGSSAILPPDVARKLGIPTRF